MADLYVGGFVDPASHDRTEDARLATDSLTTHGVIVGMTGSGKTGLGVDLVEEALLAGVPALLVDPKGDLTNLCLTFPDLSPAEFRPWIDESAAKAAGQSPDDFAAAQAKAWTDGLAGWKYGTEQIRTLRSGVDFTIYTPGSQAGRPINLVGSLQAPTIDDPEAVSDDIEGYVSGVLGLIGVDADPLSSREHILLSNLVQHAWTSGASLDLPTLVAQVQQPPIERLGVVALDEFFPAKDRKALAMQLNGLLASPSFAAWAAGDPLDIEAMLHTSDGRPRCAIVTTAHLGDEERQFATSILLSKLVTWTRRQSGTTDLRALLYMDEVHGYLPPSATPPTKKPIMTLMKTARAFGVGVVLSTQNPADLDYKAITNAGTWMIGRLQAKRDKDRLLDGMSGVDGGVDLKALDDTISGLDKREFVLHRAGSAGPKVFTTRWALSYLRGPLTKDQIKLLQPAATQPAAPSPAPDAPAAPPASTTAPAATPAADAPGAPAPTPAPASAVGAASTTPVMPAVAAGIGVRWVAAGAPWLTDVGGDPAGTVWEPGILATTDLRYDEAKADFVLDQAVSSVLFPLSGGIDPTRAVSIVLDPAHLRTAAPPSVSYRFVDVAIGDTKTWKQVERGLVDQLVRGDALTINVNKELKLYSQPNETPEQFAVRCATAATAAAAAKKAAAAAKQTTQASKLDDQRDAASDRAEVVAEQAKERKRGNWLRAAGDVVGGIFGSSREAAARVGRAADRVTRNSDDKRVDEAAARVARIEQQRADLDAALAQELAAIDAASSASAAAITTMSVPLERTDVKVRELLLVWVPVP